MSGTGNACKCCDEAELRRGPWTLEEDALLIHCIACHGEGRWNLLARRSGLKRTGKSCRLRWLNYLKPDVKRGNLTPEEQILILELHSKWGNRWSRIAQHLPGRTDNEIKNYWRTRVQKQARQLKIDANSTTFRDAVRCLWTPRAPMETAAGSALPSAEKTSAGLPAHDLHPDDQLLLPPPPPPASLPIPPDDLPNPTGDNCSHSRYAPVGAADRRPCTSPDSAAVAQLRAAPEFPPSPDAAIGNHLLLLLHHHNLLPGGRYINNASYGLQGPGLVPTSTSGGGGGGGTAADHWMVANSSADNVADGPWSMDELWQVGDQLQYEWED